MSKIVILGAGVMGSALAVPLSENGHDVRLVGTFLDRDIISAVAAGAPHPGLGRRLPATVTALQLEDLAVGFADADIILSGVNSMGVRWAASQLAPLLAPHHHVIAIAKGMEADDRGELRILPTVLAQETPTAVREQVSWSAITGPSIAGEVAARRQSCVVFAGDGQPALDLLADAFRTDWYHVWTTTDLVGAEACAAAKNCFALGVGLATGLIERAGEGNSADRAHDLEAALFAQGAVETRRLVALLGGDPETPLWLPGIGDMYVTSTGGRNVRVGRLLGAGYSFVDASGQLGNPTLEGAAAIEVIGAALVRLAARGVVGTDEFPLLGHLYEVIALEQPLDIPWECFFGGEPTPRRAARPVATSG